MEPRSKLRSAGFTAQVASTVLVHLSWFLGSLILMDVGSSLGWWEQHSHGVGHLDRMSYLLTGDRGHGTSTLWTSTSPHQIIRPPCQGCCKDSEAIKLKRTTQSIYCQVNLMTRLSSKIKKHEMILLLLPIACWSLTAVSWLPVHPGKSFLPQFLRYLCSLFAIFFPFSVHLLLSF